MPVTSPSRRAGRTPTHDRVWRRLGLAGATAGIALVGLAGPAAAVDGQVRTTTKNLVVHDTPRLAGKSVGSLAPKTRITIVCQTPGDSVQGPEVSSTIWDKLSTGGYVADAWVSTGSDGYVAPRCGTAQPSTNRLLDFADNYVGGYARAACEAAGMGGKAHYQCKQFVSCTVSKVYGRNIAGYYDAYRRGGFQKVSKDAARPGDIVQLNSASNRNGYVDGMHTAILASAFRGNTATVVDSNFGGDARGKERVRKHDWNPYTRGLEVNIWRFVG